MPETFILDYLQSHVYYRNLVACLSQAEKHFSVQHTPLREVCGLISSLEDGYVQNNGSLVEPVTKLKKEHAAEVPATQRSVVICGDSGFVDATFLREVVKVDVDTKLKDLMTKLGLPTTTVVTDEGKTVQKASGAEIVHAALQAILEGKDPQHAEIPYRQLLMWIYFKSSVGNLKVLLDNQQVRPEVRRITKGFYSIQYRGLNYLRGGADVTTVIQTGIRRKVKVRKYTVKFSKPLLHMNEGKEQVEVAKRLLETLQPVIGLAANDVMLVLKGFSKLDQELQPNSVSVETVGPFLFVGNANYHTFARYLKDNGVATKEKLAEVNPEAFVVASIAEQIRVNPKLFALAVSKTTKTETGDQSDFSRSLRLYAHPDIVVPGNVAQVLQTTITQIGA